MIHNAKMLLARLLCLVLAAILAFSVIPLGVLRVFAAQAEETVTRTVPLSIDLSLKTNAYGCTYTDQWIPMFPDGQPDNNTTWPEWDDTHCAQIVYEGYQDIGALHMTSAEGKNTAVAIKAGMTTGRSYTLGMWVKGSTDNPNKVLTLYGNGNGVLIGQPEYGGDGTVITSDWMYVEKTFKADTSQLNLLVPDWGNTEVYIDNITLKQYSWSKNLLSGTGDFFRSGEVPVTYEPMVLNPLRTSSSYNCQYSECWVPMFPTGEPDNSTTWPEWDSNRYGEIVADGYGDMGALHMKSQRGKNVGVTIQAGMTPGASYTLGMWVKGSTDNSNKVLSLYGNGDGVMIGNPQYSPDGIVGSRSITANWSYVERTFTATQSQLNLIVPDWGNTEVFIDNITLKDAAGKDLLSGKGDFYQAVSTAVQDANLDFEANATGTPYNWTHQGVLADSSATLYTENVYSGNQALRIHRQNGEMDCSFLYSQSYIPVSYKDSVELVAHIASRNSISGNFSMYVLGLDENGATVDSAFGQERITNAGDTWSQWDTYSMLYTVPEKVKYLQFCIRVGGTNADVLIDDLTYYNYTENQNRIYLETFDRPSATTGLPGGWQRENASGNVQCNGKLILSGDNSGNPRLSTRLYTLKTAHYYELTADVMTDGTANGRLILEAVNWKGETTSQVVTQNLSTGGAEQSLKVEFEARSAVFYRLIVEKTAGSGSVCVDHISLRQTALPTKGTNTENMAQKAPAAAEPTTTSSVQTVGGKTYMVVNGEPVVPIWYARPENPILYKDHTVTKFAEVGVDTVVTYVFLNNNYGDVWTRNGFASDGIDDMMLSTLAGNPNAKFIVALDFNAPQWWCEENPGELAALANSTPERTNASFASEKWKKESTEIMLQAIDYMMAQSYADQIVGFKITGGYTLEWNWWATSGVYDDVGDFSQCGIAAFRKWLTEKYGTDQALQAAYGDSSITLQNAMPPSAALRSDDYLDSVITVQDHPQMMDYELYMAELKADTIEYFASVVKDAIQDRLIVGTYGGYFYMGGGYEFTTAVANVYFQKLLQSEHIDFIKSPWMYGMRQIGDSAQFMGPVDSLDLYGKLWIVEDDSRLNLQLQAAKQDDNAALGWTRDYQESVESLKRNFSYILSKGMGISFYNLMWNFTDDDQYYGVIGQMYKEMEKSLCIESQSTADIAVFVDGESNMLIPYEEEVANSVLYVSVLREQLEKLGHIGASYDMYLLDDLKDGLVPEHKINIFLATTMITQEERAAIESQLQKNGNILVWIFTDGISDGKTTDIALMKSLIGMELSILSTRRQHTATAKICNVDHWLTNGMNLNQPYSVETYDKLSPLIGITDSKATTLAYHTGTKKVAMAVKDMGDWTSVYSAIPNLPQELFRNMLSFTGSHIYTDSPSDVIYANSDYVALHSIFAGERTVHLPQKATVYDVFAGKVIATDCSSFTVTLSGKETRLFRLTNPASLELDTIDPSAMTGAYTAPASWTPMYPTGTPDSGTWEGWNDTHYAQITSEGYADPGALHLKSYSHKNTAVAIDAGMAVGKSYTLGLWAKGTSNSGKVLALYANGDPVIIGASDQLTADWSYYEITFTASISQINLMASDWGNTDIYIDNITLKGTDGKDLLAGRGDFGHLDGGEKHNFVAASCTEPEICFACGKTGASALGHSYGDWVITKPATLQNAGSMQRTCTICKDIVTEEIPCLAGDVEGWSLTLGGDLTVNFKMRIHPDIQNTAQVVLTVAEKSICYTVSEHTPDDNGVYLFSVPVAAAQMADDITVQIVNGNDACTPRTYRVVDYARYVLANESMSSLHKLVKEMLSYGAAAQTYFGYNTQHLANTGIVQTGEQEIPAQIEQSMSINDSVQDLDFYSASLVFRSKNAVRFYLSGDVSGCSFTANGLPVSGVEKDGKYCIEIAEILPQDLDKQIELTATDENGNTLIVVYSPMDYILRMNRKGTENLKVLLKALYNYHLAAKSYLQN